MSSVFWLLLCFLVVVVVFEGDLLFTSNVVCMWFSLVLLVVVIWDPCEVLDPGDGGKVSREAYNSSCLGGVSQGRLIHGVWWVRRVRGIRGSASWDGRGSVWWRPSWHLDEQ